MVANKDIATLLIEDDNSWALLVSERLQAMAEPVKLTRAVTLAEGIGLLRAQPFDLILLDLNLPDSGGWNSLEAVVAVSSNTPIVVCTDVPFVELDALAALNMGAEDCVSKATMDRALFQHVIVPIAERHWLNQRHRDLEYFEPLAPRDTPPPLRESSPGKFAALTQAYRNLLGLALERTDSGARAVTVEVAGFSGELADLGCGPRDVFDIHLLALRQLMRETAIGGRETLRQEGRVLVFNVVGSLAAYYRKIAIAARRNAQSVTA